MQGQSVSGFVKIQSYYWDLLLHKCRVSKLPPVEPLNVYLDINLWYFSLISSVQCLVGRP